jgi:catechol 2,3-dioxygenase-like lactoylglutathione lyase family enzyme
MTRGLNAIGIVVADMAAAIAFYRRLGLEFTAGSDDHQESELAGGIRLMLDTEESVKPFTSDWTPPSGSPRVAFAFEFDSPAAVDAKYDELVKAGCQASREPWDAFWGQRYASVLDPDGNGVDLYARLPQPG